MDFDGEMQKALEADGEKLRQLTGEDHGPVFIADAPEVWLDCPECGGEGSIEVWESVSKWSIDPPCAHVVPCEACNGTGGMICEAEGDPGTECASAITLTGKDNCGKPRQAYADRIAAMDAVAFLKEAELSIWLSAYANNNPRSDYHWHADACYDEAARRGRPDLYKTACERAARSAS